MNSRFVMRSFKTGLIFILIAVLSLSGSEPDFYGAQETILAPGSPIKYESSPEDEAFLKEIRKALISKKKIPEKGSDLEKIFLKTSFPKIFYAFALFIYEPGKVRIKTYSLSREPMQDIIYAVNTAMRRPEFKSFHLDDPALSRLQIDFVLNKPTKVDPLALNQSAMNQTRFEIGVDGMTAAYQGKISWYFPGDAFVKSHLYLRQVYKSLLLRFKHVPIEKIRFSRFTSESYVSFSHKKTREKWIRLYRGYPVMGPLKRSQIERAAKNGVDYLLRYQKKNGQFLYYYDAARDNYRDHEHPYRNLNNLYYNELRHAGGGVLLLYDYKISKNKALLPPARAAIDFLMGIAKEYDLPDGRKAAYYYYNRKAKLGGSGIGLYLLSEYQHVTGDKRYREQARLAANHITGNMTEEGEFLYYYIYLDKKVELKDNQHFSFYYPGEALIGLATYYKYVADEDEKPYLEEKIHAALNFLLNVRPKKYTSYFQTLPSDSWLMMAINELWDVPVFRRESYKNYVYSDAKQMMDHCYNLKDALYPDYPGAFYYKYGDFPYADGARAEGLMGAYALAVKAGDKEQEEILFKALTQTAWATLHLVNTEESIYSARNPQKAFGGIRFKHTRQWFRVDTIQHVAAFYLKFLPYLQKSSD